MSLVTGFLGLFKHDTSNDTDLNSNFDIDTALNGNWDKIDAAMKKVNDDKVDKVTGKGLSSKDFTVDYETKLKNISSGAQVNVIEKITLGGTEIKASRKDY